MSAANAMKGALRCLRGAKTGLRTAREHARRLGRDEKVRALIEQVWSLEAEFVAVADELGTEEARRTINLKKHRSAA